MKMKARGIEEYRMMMLNIIKATKDEVIVTNYNKDDDVYTIIVKEKRS